MKKLLLILLCLPFIGFGQNVYIPDANFKAYLVGEPLINTNGDTEIQVSEATAFNSTINCSYMNISDLTGIEAFTALTALYCSSNQLTSLDLSNNTALSDLDAKSNSGLTYLDLSNNTGFFQFRGNSSSYVDIRYCASVNVILDNSNIQDITLLNINNVIDTLFALNMSNLTYFSSNNYDFYALVINNNPVLTNVTCGNSNLRYLEIENNTALTSLYCNNNQLTSLDLSQITALNDLYCSSNQLTSLDLSNNTALNDLNCSYNQLTSIDASNQPLLDTLHCNNNQLTTLDVHQFLAGLNCYNNQLTSLDVSQYINLQSLRCDFNYIECLDISNNSVLNNLDCNDNLLTQLITTNNNFLNLDVELQNNNLGCVEVDNIGVAYNDWHYDSFTTFSINCNYINDCNNFYSIYGCTDSLASNYDSTATVDDGSCLLNLSVNMLVVSNPTCVSCYDGYSVAEATGGVGPYNYIWSNGNTGPFNFNLGVGSYTVYASDSYGNIATASLLLTPGIAGCTDSTAFNYDPSATTDDGSCISGISACTDTLACNYNAAATVDDGSCILPDGCTNPTATNYNPAATCDDGSCNYSSSCAEPTPTAMNVTDIVHNRATINWDNMNGGTCFIDQYRIQYREVGASSLSQKTMSGPVGSCTFASQKTDKLLLNLTANTNYEYQMKAWYCGGGASSWSAIETFTTLDACPNVGNLTVNTPNTTKATFNWDASNGNYEFVRIKSRVDSISNPSNADWFNVGGAGVSYPTFTKNKNNLTPGETYRAQARTWCDPYGGAYKSDTWTPLVYWTQPTIRIEGGESIVNLEVYPNPSKDVFNISFTSESIQDLRVRVLSIVGEELIVEDLQQFIGEYTKKVSLNENAKGIYFLEIETKDGIINKKLILQ